MNRPNLDSTENRIRRVFVEALSLNVSAEELGGVERLNDVSGVDSLAALEREFGIELEPDRMDLEFLTDLPALVKYFDDRCGGTAEPD